jgi:hypothetical protein
MGYRESDIAHENGAFWVLKDRAKKCYTVFRPNSPHASESDSSYPLTENGLSLAIARADYLAKREADKRFGQPHYGH